MLLALGLVAVGLLSFAPVASAASAGPSLSFSPSSWTAGPIDSGATTSQVFTLINTGGRSSGAVDLALSGSAAFSIEAGSDSCTGRALGPGKSCSVTVEYAPTSNGAIDPATLSANGGHASTDASLSGSSTTPNPFPRSKSDCEALGGTFSTSDANYLWSCNNASQDVNSLSSDCFADGGNVFALEKGATPSALCRKQFGPAQGLNSR